MLIEIFCTLKALSEYYKTGHWQVKNTIYYSDHLLLDRLAEESQEQLDAIAEKIVGTTGNSSILNLNDVLKKQYELIKNLPYTPNENTAFFEAGLSLEQRVLELCASVDSSPETSVGIKNMIGDIADESEARVYLLKQRLSTGVSKSKPSDQVSLTTPAIIKK